jgi:predicted N-acetyltransferase YhbS
MHLAIVMVLGNHEYYSRFQNASPDRAQTGQARRSGVADSVLRCAANV